MKEIGNRLQARARELGLTDSEVARRLGLAQNRYSAYVNGRREPDLMLFARICSVLRMTPNDALGVDGAAERVLADASRAKADFLLDGLSVPELHLAARLLGAIRPEDDDAVTPRGRPRARRSASRPAGSDD